MRRILIHTVIILAILLLGTSPLISALTAGAVANANDCTLHEGFVNSCMIGGIDWGEALYMFGTLGWLALATLPIALGAAFIYLLIVIIIALIQAARRRKAAAESSLPPQ